MNCTKKQQMLVDYAEQILPERKATRIQRHLDQCASCRSEFERIKKVREQLLSLQAPQLGEIEWARFQQNLSRKLDDPAPLPSRRISRRAPLILAGAATFCILVLLIAVVAHLPRQDTPPRVAGRQAAPAPIENGTPNYDAFLAALADSDEELEEFSPEIALLTEDEWSELLEHAAADLSGGPDVQDEVEELTLEECDEMLERMESI